ncbi:hypothetical protein ACO0QE_000366 [Hanseniaspora vineae]
MTAFLNRWIQDQCLHFGTQRVDYLNERNGIKKLGTVDDKKLFVPVVFLITAFLLFHTRTTKHSSPNTIYQTSNASFESTTSDIFFAKENEQHISNKPDEFADQEKDTTSLEETKVVTLDSKTLSENSSQKIAEETDISPSAKKLDKKALQEKGTLIETCNTKPESLLDKCNSVLEIQDTVTERVLNAEKVLEIEERSLVETAEITAASVPSSNGYTETPKDLPQHFDNKEIDQVSTPGEEPLANTNITKQDTHDKISQIFRVHEEDIKSAITASEKDLQKTNKTLESQELEPGANQKVMIIDKDIAQPNNSSPLISEQEENKISLPVVNLLPKLRSKSSAGSLDSGNDSERTSKLSNLGSIKALSSSESPKVKELIEIFENIKEPEIDIFSAHSTGSGGKGKATDSVAVPVLPSPSMFEGNQPSSFSTSPRRNFNNNITLVSVSQASSQGSALSADLDKTPTKTGNSMGFSSVGLMTSTSAHPSVTTAVNETPTKGAISTFTHKP